MATIDLSRSATDFRKHYRSVRAYQGRVLLDDDHNENERIRGEDERRSRAHIIGATGSPDDGFKVANPVVTGGKIDFDISPGTMYIGGHAAELEQKETFQQQSDWLQLAGNLVPAPPAAGTRRDLVVLEARLQPVSPVEDSELFEHALGLGGDTAGRMKLIRRVRVIAGVNQTECQKAWQSVLTQWQAQNLGTLSNQNELLTDATLTVDFVAGDDGDLCSPPVQDGYLGADNQAIRVQITEPNQFTWGFDNASSTYRVTAGNAASAQPVITMLTEPKDQAHWPRAGQIVEVLPWGALLPNGEKIAEFSGHLARVASAYNPTTKSFTITGALPGGAAFGTGWFPPQPPGQAFFFLRVWDRGSDTASPPAIPFGAAPLPLGQTGLRVKFSGTQLRRHDYWIIAARPETPDLVVPWQLKSGRGPHGMRRFFAPLALLEWTAAGGKVLSDCRDTFLPLVRQKGCCTYTVGDGITSFGRFTSIQKAIDSLQPTGGEICLLPGTFNENVQIKALDNIRIHGCGHRSIVRDASGGKLPVIHILGSTQITLDSIRVQAEATRGVVAEGNEKRSCRILRMNELEVEARDRYGIECRSVEDLRIERCTITVATLRDRPAPGVVTGSEPAVFISGRDILFERNEVLSKAQRSLVGAAGGLQIGGGSQDVQIRRNRIAGGNGNGISLGSIVYTPVRQPGGPAGAGILLFPVFGFVTDDNGCIHPDPDPPDPRDHDGNPVAPQSEGDLRRIRIINNVIEDMGTNGIATARFFSDAAKAISVRDLEIIENRIQRCLRLDRHNLKPVQQVYCGFGGIALSVVDYLFAVGNRIEDNGPSFVDATCGIFILHGSGLLIEQNTIRNNGPLIDTHQQASAGARGGIHIRRALAPYTISEVANRGAFDDGYPALRVHANTVVSPMGPALHATVRGSAFIEANHFVSDSLESVPASSALADTLALLLGGHGVRIVNLSTTFEFAGLARFKSLTSTYGVGVSSKVVEPGWTALLPRHSGGNLVFNDNEVLLKDGLPALPVATSSVLLFCLGDLSVDANQLSADLRGTDLLSDLLAFGMSVRVTANRLTEWFRPQRLSGLTAGLFNETSLNQSTMCLFGTSPAALRVVRDNRSWIDLVSPGACEALSKRLAVQMAEFGWQAKARKKHGEASDN